MTTNKPKFDFESQELADTYDEQPLWSAAFGLLLLKHVPLQREAVYLDVGCGTGFPLLELAGRLDSSCTCIGVDTWKTALCRLEKKRKAYRLSNVRVLEESAEAMSLSSGSVDHVVSNLGINNFASPSRTLQECYRVLKPNGTLTLTTNLTGHWQLFYDIFKATLSESGLTDIIERVRQDEAHRGTPDSVRDLLEKNSFTVCKVVEDVLEMRYLNGSAFLHNYFANLGWIPGWKEMIPDESLRNQVFSRLESNLNEVAEKNGGILRLDVPMLLVTACKYELLKYLQHI